MLEYVITNLKDLNDMHDWEFMKIFRPDLQIHL